MNALFSNRCPTVTDVASLWCDACKGLTFFDWLRQMGVVPAPACDLPNPFVASLFPCVPLTASRGAPFRIMRAGD